MTAVSPEDPFTQQKTEKYQNNDDENSQKPPQLI